VLEDSVRVPAKSVERISYRSHVVPDMVELSDPPRWAILGGFGGLAFFLIWKGELPAVYNLFGTQLPLEQLSLLVAIAGVGFGLLYQFDNI